MNEIEDVFCGLWFCGPCLLVSLELEEDKEVPASFLSRFHCSATVSARDNIYRGRLKSMFQVA